MTFNQIASEWQTWRELPQGFLIRLIGPERGWFDACRAYACGGEAPEAFPEVNEILARMSDHARRIAQIHLDVAGAVCAAVSADEPWTSRGALTAEEAQALQQRLAEMAATKHSMPAYGPAFLRDLAAVFLGMERPAAPAVSALFPLVSDDPTATEPGVLAQFELERLPFGSGELFMAPEQAFTELGSSFLSIFADAPEALKIARELRGMESAQITDVRVRIIDWKTRAPLRVPLLGRSGGGALALGLWSVWTDTPLEPGVVTSFSLRCPQTGALDGNCHPVGSAWAKAQAVAVLPNGLFLVAQAQVPELQRLAAQIKLEVRGAEALHSARVIGVGAGEYVRRRLEATDDTRALYTPLRGYRDRRPTAAELMAHRHLYLMTRAQGEADGPEPKWVRERLPDLRDLLGERGNFVLVGAPGGGKTFTLEALEHLALEKYQQGEAERLPVFLPLRVWDQAIGTPEVALKRFVCAQAKELEPIFEDYLMRGKFLFLCDALNEMPDYRSDSRQVQLLAAWIEAYGEPEKPGTADRPRCRFIFTCRTENYQVKLPARRVDVSDLDDGQRGEMARNYLGGDPGPFLNALRERKVWEMCENPLTLYGFLALYVEGRDLPPSLGGLFRALYELWFEYADRRIQQGFPSAVAGVERITVEIGLQALAYQLHASALSTGAGVQTDLQRNRARQLLSTVSLDSSTADQVLAATHELRFVQLLKVDRLFPNKDRVKFVYQRWQEFWTAVQIGQEQGPDGTAFTAEDWRRFWGDLRSEAEMPDRQALRLDDHAALPEPEPTRWEEPLLMLAGIQGETADEFVLRALNANPLFAARCLTEGRAQVSAGVEQAVAARLVEVLEDRVSGLPGVSVRDRIAAGRALGHLADPRFPVDAATGLILPPLVEIASVSDFLMGTTDADLKQYRRQLKDRWRDDWVRDEKPAHPVALDRFGMGKYPVTVREYAQFVEAGGYTDARWRGCWTDGGWEWLQERQHEAPVLWNDERFASPGLPVVGVTWFEAVAYCHWLNAQVGERRYRLPTEAEWEYAARGEARRLWPWGNEWGTDAEAAGRCNGELGDRYVGSTSPVGMYPPGRTALGVEEMVGNVWEWCWDWYDAGYYSSAARGGPLHNPRGPAEGQYRVLRGGSWGSDPFGLRAAFRDGCDPNYRILTVGFRVASGR